MTQEELNQLSNYSGDDLLDNYTGAGDDLVDFGGIGKTFASEIDRGKIAVISMVNANAATRSFYLGVGLVYVKGSEANGQMKTGAFNDVDGNAGLTGSYSPSVGSIEKFIAYYRHFATMFGGMKVTSTVATQIDQVVTLQEEDPFATQQSRNIHLSAHADETAYQDKKVTVPEPFQLDARTLVTFPVVGSSTLTLTLFAGPSMNLAAALKKKAARAEATITRVGRQNLVKVGRLTAARGKVLGA